MYLLEQVQKMPVF